MPARCPPAKAALGPDWEGTGAQSCCRWAAHVGGGSRSITPPHHHHRLPQPAGARWSAPLISPYLPKPLANVTLMELKSTRFVLLGWGFLYFMLLFPLFVLFWLSPKFHPPPQPPLLTSLFVLEIERGRGLEGPEGRGGTQTAHGEPCPAQSTLGDPKTPPHG